MAGRASSAWRRGQRAMRCVEANWSGSSPPRAGVRRPRPRLWPESRIEEASATAESFVALYPSRETLELASGQYLLILHAYQKLFHRSGPEALDQTSDGTRSGAGRGFRSLIDVSLSFQTMAQISLTLKTPQQCSDAGIFKGMLRQEAL